MSHPRTAKDALIAEMLGDIDGMLSRIEQYPELIRAAHLQLGASAQALERAGSEYRQVVATYTEAAKLSLQDFALSKAADIRALQPKPCASDTPAFLMQAVFLSAGLSAAITAVLVLAVVKFT